MSAPAETGYAPVNGLELYWERYGDGGTPLVVLHGGFGLISMASETIDRLAARRRVIAVELQGHGHTRDIDRVFSYEAFGDDIAALIEHLGLERADVLGYSLGAGAALRAAIQRPDRVRRLAIVSFPFRRDGWFPEIRAAFDQMSSVAFEFLLHSPLHTAWAEVAPDPNGFPALIDKIGELQRRPFDWTDEVRGLLPPTVLVFADADSIPISHVADFYALLGGGLRDGGVDGSARPQARLAVVPGQTHYDIFQSPQVATTVAAFLDD
jgi:pimeloyl-ACP methyl ester carboxylesterase